MMGRADRSLCLLRLPGRPLPDAGLGAITARAPAAWQRAEGLTAGKEGRRPALTLGSRDLRFPFSLGRRRRVSGQELSEARELIVPGAMRIVQRKSNKTAAYDPLVFVMAGLD